MKPNNWAWVTGEGVSPNGLPETQNFPPALTPYRKAPTVNVGWTQTKDCHLIEYPRASIQAENARLKVSMPCWYVACACASCCCCCCAVACAACCLAALLAFRCFAPPTIAPAVAPAAAPVPASSSAIAPTAAPPAAPLAAPLTRPPFACWALSAAACCSAFNDNFRVARHPREIVRLKSHSAASR